MQQVHGQRLAGDFLVAGQAHTIAIRAGPLFVAERAGPRRKTISALGFGNTSRRILLK
jgi:hypothetical protein